MITGIMVCFLKQEGKERNRVIGILFKIDPVLVSIGIIGLIFAILIKKDLFLYYG